MFNKFLADLGEFLTGLRYEDDSVFLVDQKTFYNRLAILVKTKNITEDDLPILKEKTDYDYNAL